MVREFAKAAIAGPLHLRPLQLYLPNPQDASPSFCRDAVNIEKSALKAIYLNLDFPAPTREWEGVFDIWLQGDAQYFAVRRKRKKIMDAINSSTMDAGVGEGLCHSPRQNNLKFNSSSNQHGSRAGDLE
ncbi:hypothetical protein AX17_004878 [Amanita inopinata Kibby_2008]|nr:hypothetical protein AX17_004878 [Amanita inopinata Kibby_2008]